MKVKKSTRFGALKLGVALVALWPGLALANSAEAPGEEAPADQPIVVTGTLIRGSQAVGSQTIGIDQSKLEAIGAPNTADLIANIPQAGLFMGFVGIRGSNNFSVAVNRPSLRYLGNTSGSTNSTLMLLDGHRMPGMGILQTTPDLDAIAPGAIERVEIVTDGGSSIYGSDAVGGVMNFITRKEFDGIEARGSYGFADNYQAINAAITAGTKWEGGSAYVSYDYSWHDEIYGADRDWSQSRDWVNNVGANKDCSPGNITAGGNTYALPGLTAGLGNRCDLSELQTIYPRETKHSVFASLHLDSGGPLSFSLKSFYLNRKSFSDGGPLSATAGTSVPASSPFYVPIAGVTSAEVFVYNFSPLWGNSSAQTTELESFGVTPSIDLDLGSNWHLNALASYGTGRATFLGNLVNLTPVTTAAAAGTFNPANLSAAGNAATLATARDWFQYGRAMNKQANFRAVFDGKLFDLPGGALGVAAGVELLQEQYIGNNSRGITAAGMAALTDFKKRRTVKSVFGELNAPILDMLTINASGRYDDYSDFGSTFNPKVGANFKPAEWLTIRGNWSKAFQAPGLSDLALATNPNWNLLPTAVRPFTKPGLAPGSTNRNILVVLGGVKAPLDPQKAETWSLGIDLKPVPGLALGATYYNIDFKGAIGIPPIFTPATFYAEFPNNFVTYDAGNAALQSYFNSLATTAGNSAATLAGLPSGFDSVYAVMDSRSTNLARIKTSGLDLYLRYRHETSFGAIYTDIAGTYITKFLRQANPNAGLVDQRPTDFSKLRMTASIGAEVGQFKTQFTWNHSQGFATIGNAANLNQTRVASYNLFNLFAQYKVPSDSGVFRDMSFSLNVDNLFDTDPPLYRGARGSLFGVDNGFTLGRLVRLGVSKKF
ncbi:TonB-dependent receptor domain-containing protein [Novosphingobium aquae]|uniref:TonB-dependent receptor n=1 Tax=Novosphingobium aquae TaxID=3133435 RepID=A0ABU8SCH9_9SPHN